MAMTQTKSCAHGATAFLQDRLGATAIVMAVLTPILIGGLAFGAEVGYWQLAQRRLQNAADTAAYAAGTQIRSGEDAAAVKAAAAFVAEDSGYGGGSSGVTVQSPPATAPLAADGTDPNGDNSYVYVILNDALARRFTKYFANGSATVDFQAAALARIENGRPACVLALHPSAAGAVTLSGSANVELRNCDVAANSISSSAVLASGNSASLETDCVSTVGAVDDGGQPNITYADCPGPIENAALTADPYRHVTAPTCAGTYQNPNNFDSGPNPKNQTPGCWGDVSTRSLNISKTVNLAPGTYIFRNVDIALNGNGLLTGIGVTIFLEGASSLRVNGNATIDIKAPTSGPLSGIALFGDRGAAGELDLSGNSGVSVVGAIYSPNSDITYIGNTAGFAAGECTQIIGATIVFTGSADLDVDCSATGATEIKTAQSISIVG